MNHLKEKWQCPFGSIACHSGFDVTQMSRYLWQTADVLYQFKDEGIKYIDKWWMGQTK